MHTISKRRCCLIAFLVALACPPPAHAQQNTPPPILVTTNWNIPVLVVSGTGEVEVRPDRALIRLGAEAQAKDASKAQVAVNEVLQSTIAAIRDLGVPRQSFQTVGLNLLPVYSTQKPGEETRPPKIVGYRALNTLQIELGATNLDMAGTVIDRGLENGANRLEGLSYELSTNNPERTSALRLAIEKARAKAQAMADALRVRLGDVIEVSETEAQPMPRARIMRSMQAGAAMAAPTPVEPGALNLTASVTIRYQIENQSSPPRQKKNP